ncbi:MAG: hypothetical protein JNK87_21620 [Bryobacterales bacterium]|nr:hypothetical protein [Bryobacterales bacterium]
MSPEGKIITFTVDESFDVSLRLLRRALALEGLRVPCEVDAAARVRQELGVVLKQNVVLYVDDPIRLLEGTAINPAGGLFIPEPVVLSNLDDRACRVSVRSMEPLFSSELPASLRGAVANLHERVLDAIQRIGQKQTPATDRMGARAIPA